MSYNIDLPHFTGRNVPISEIANATGKDPQYLRIGLQRRKILLNTIIFVLIRKSGRNSAISER